MDSSSDAHRTVCICKPEHPKYRQTHSEVPKFSSAEQQSDRVTVASVLRQLPSGRPRHKVLHSSSRGCRLVSNMFLQAAGGT